MRQRGTLWAATMRHMGTLYLVRHGQASFGAADYDQLSPLGVQQCQALGGWFASHGLQFDAVLCGTLRRHAQTLAGLGQGYSQNPGDLPAALPWPGLNEYDSEAVIRAFHTGPLAAPTTAEITKAHFRLLRDALLAWMQGRSAPQGMPAYADWVGGITSALDHVRAHCSANPDAKVLMVSSGGPIATAVGHVLGTAMETTIELNLRIRNSAVTELAFNPKRMHLVSFNHLPHLDALERRGWVTHA